MEYWRRARFLISQPLGEDGRPVTGSRRHQELARQAAEEGIVLLKNSGVLPFAPQKKLAMFGAAQTDFVKGGFGSGTVWTQDHNLYDTLKAYLELFLPLSEFYRETAQALQEHSFQTHKVQHAQKEFSEMQYIDGDLTGVIPEPKLPEALVQAAADFTDTALVVISRTAGEAHDRKPVAGDFCLSADELALLELVKEKFSHVVAVVNVGGLLDAAWMEDPRIEAVLYIGTPGMMGAFAAADILCGRVNPSGRLADTVARHYEDYPSSASYLESPDFVDYEEDIYVGYRYFETVPGGAEKVVFPFGHGLSYTEFSLRTEDVRESDGQIQITVRVENTGAMAGKQVVQVYHGAPQGKLGKAARSLVAFGKTALLQPGQCQSLTLRFAANDMASYDDTGAVQKSAYILEQGDYPIYAGTSVRQLEQVYTYTVSEPVRIVAQMQERCAATFLRRRMRADGSFQPCQIRIPRTPAVPNVAVPQVEKPERIMHLADVLDGNCTLDAFIKQLSVEQMAALLGGIPGTGVCQTGGFGGLAEFGIPAIMTSDGPAGVRMKRQAGIQVTCFPGASVLANTWNTELAWQVGCAIAMEMKENNMYAWLAPALNIHRNPLCGRNFEYYSEDPLISGKMAAATVQGAQSQRISATPKHFACNNKEQNRKRCDSRVSERALREIYLKGFEICVREGRPRSLMTSYNRLNGLYPSENPELMTGILRQEWGFDGCVMTDWFNHVFHCSEIRAGNDLKMPFGDEKSVAHGFRKRTISEGHLKAAVRNVLSLILWYEGGRDQE